ncbi:MAG: D-alanine--D-alanine ligase [Eggerthellaceae bacterium]|nr:D-alanine--D-alanine ligase [Eggerthellaceae bacterium]
MAGTIDPQQCKVALLRGGTSGEREVSLASGAAVAQALRDTGFRVTEFDPSIKKDLIALMQGDFDVAFLALHGRGGEDGTIQGFLETIALPYTGSGVCASALAMNKCKAKQIFRSAGLPTLPSVTLNRTDDYSIDEIVGKLGDHCVIKASKEGSSIGLYIEQGKAAIQEAIGKAFEHDDQVLVEKYCKARELTVGVIGNDHPHALPIIEIVPKNDFYDYEAKYAPGGSQHLCPAPIDEGLTASIQNTAEGAHKALGCHGYSRTDFLLEGNGAFWVLETNTLPGMTATSLLPDAASKIGMSYEQLCARLIELALEQ